MGLIDREYADVVLEDIDFPSKSAPDRIITAWGMTNPDREPEVIDAECVCCRRPVLLTIAERERLEQAMQTAVVEAHRASLDADIDESRSRVRV